MAIISPTPKFQAFDSNGDPLVGGKLFTWENGTTTKKTTYTTEDQATPNTNPIILDSRGECDLWLDTGIYTLGLYPASETNDPPTGSAIWTVNDITAGGSGTTSVSNIAALRALSGGSSNIVILRGYTTDNDGGAGTFYWDATDTTADNNGTIIAPSGGGTGRWNRLYYKEINVKWFGATGDGSTDDTTAINNAITALPATGGTLIYPRGTYKIASNITTGSVSKLINVVMMQDAEFTAASAITVEFFSTIDAGDWQIFAGSATGIFTNVQDFVRASWWGSDGLASAVSAVSAQNTTILINETQTLSADLTIPRNVTLDIKRNGQIAGAYSLRVKGDLKAGLHQIFDTNIILRWINGSPQTEVYPEWWGAIADGQRVSSVEGADITNGVNTVIFSLGNYFASTDVGKVITISQGAGSNIPLVTTISGFTNDFTIDVTDAPGDTLTNLVTYWGTDNTTAFERCCNSTSGASENDGWVGDLGPSIRVIVQDGIYIINGVVNIENHSGLIVQGRGKLALLKITGANAAPTYSGFVFENSVFEFLDIRFEGAGFHDGVNALQYLLPNNYCVVAGAATTNGAKNSGFERCQIDDFIIAIYLRETSFVNKIKNCFINWCDLAIDIGDGVADSAQSGTITNSSGSPTITGSGTTFGTGLSIGQTIKWIDDSATTRTGIVKSIESNISLTLTANTVSNTTGKAYNKKGSPGANIHYNITGNVFSECKKGIRLQNAENVIISDNTLECGVFPPSGTFGGDTGTTVHFALVEDTCKNIQITNNSFLKCPLVFSNCFAGFVFAGNAVDNFIAQFLLKTNNPASTGNTITNNYINARQNVGNDVGAVVGGFLLFGSGVVDGNTLINCGTPIDLQNGPWTVSNNTIIDPYKIQDGRGHASGGTPTDGDGLGIRFAAVDRKSICQGNLVTGISQTIIAGPTYIVTGSSTAEIEFINNQVDNLKTNSALTGTLNSFAGTALQGTGTAFTTELTVNDTLVLQDDNDIYHYYTISSITDNTNLVTNETVFDTTSSGYTIYKIIDLPDSSIYTDDDNKLRMLGVTGTSSPEGVYDAIDGSTFIRTDGGLSNLMYIKEGTGNTGWSTMPSYDNGLTSGTGTLAAGTVTINTAEAKTGSLIMLTNTNAANTLHVGTITDGVSFVVNGTATDTFNWIIINE